MASRIVEEKRNALAVARRIRKGLIAYNSKWAGKPNYTRLVLSARDARGRIVGGLTGDLYWNAGWWGLLLVFPIGVYFGATLHYFLLSQISHRLLHFLFQLLFKSL